MGTVIGVLILAHLLVDFHLQTDRLAREKDKHGFVMAAYRDLFYRDAGELRHSTGNGALGWGSRGPGSQFGAPHNRFSDKAGASRALDPMEKIRCRSSDARLGTIHPCLCES